MNGDAKLTDAWREDRRYLLAVAQRILGDAAESEDVVQDAFVRLAQQHADEVHDLRGWLVVVVRRLALDRLRSAHRRLSRPTDTSDLFADELGPAPDPADRVMLDDEVRHALDVVLDRLTPAQRTPFLLHHVFGVPYVQIAELVGRSPGACRQLASEASRAIRGDAAPGTATAAAGPTAAAVARQFVQACRHGDLETLANLLDPNVSGVVTANGERIGDATGTTDVAERILFFLGPRSPWQLTNIPVEDGVGFLATQRGAPVFIGRIDIAGDRVTHIRGVVLPRPQE